MDAGSKVRRLIWDSMLSADLNRRYFAALASRLRRQDMCAKVVVAAAASAAVSGWALWGTPGLDWVWESFSALAAIVAVALPICDPAKSMKTASTLSASWFAVMRDYELLWTKVDDLSETDGRSECQTMVTTEKALAEPETTLRQRRSLARRCEREVLLARGLPAE